MMRPCAGLFGNCLWVGLGLGFRAVLGTFGLSHTSVFKLSVQYGVPLYAHTNCPCGIVYSYCCIPYKKTNQSVCDDVCSEMT